MSCLSYHLCNRLVQGYIITIDTPKSVIKGNPILVTGTTSFPEDSYFDLVLFIQSIQPVKSPGQGDRRPTQTFRLILYKTS